MFGKKDKKSKVYIDDAYEMGYKFAYIKTPAGRILRKLMMQRIPNAGERIAWGTESYKVANIMTITSPEGGETIAGYDLPVSTYIIFVELT